MTSLKLNTLENKNSYLASMLMVALVFFIPISPTIKSIFIVLCALVIFLTPYYRQYLYYTFNKLWARTALIFFLYIMLACLWSEASFSESFGVVDKYSKLVFLPIFTVAFIQRSTRYNALKCFILAMTLTCCISIIKVYLSVLKMYTARIMKVPDPDHIFYNHIVTGFMISLAVYLALTFATDREEKLWMRVYYMFVVILGSAQIIFINTGRSAYIAYFMFMAIFMLQKLPFKKAIIGVFAFIAATILAYCISPVLHEGVHRVVNDIKLLQHNQINTSVGLRVKFHQYAQSLFEKSPLLGIGTGGLQYQFAKDQPIPSWGPKLTEPHSQYWLTISEGGIVGIMLYVLFFGSLYFSALKLKETKSILIAVLSVFCVLSYSDTIFCYSVLGYLLIIISSLCFGESLEQYVHSFPATRNHKNNIHQ